MTAYRAVMPGRMAAPVQALALLLVLLMAAVVPARAQDKVQVFATQERGYGRIIVNFVNRLDLPPYKIKFDNNVVAVEFEDPVELPLPDVAVTLPDYVSIARVDPDKRGVRFGLRAGFNINHIEAGEQLFIDLLPPTWQGLPPSLPQKVIDDLADRSERAAMLAEQQRKAEEAKSLRPVASVRVGRNPTFFRVLFDWSVDTEARFEMRDDSGVITFDWPVPIDLYQLKADLPAEVVGAENVVDADGSRVEIHVAKGVVPRFYQTSKRAFIIDVDIAPEEGMKAALASEEAARKALADEVAAQEAKAAAAEAGAAAAPASAGRAAEQTSIVPTVSTIGGTVRIGFPFDKDTAAAVFRRGDTVWMLFDTSVGIEPLQHADQLDPIARNFEVIPSGDTKIVRLDLVNDRLATLGSEGRSWVLSLGDVLLNATEPIPLHRRRDQDGHVEMSADLQRPGMMHEFTDPEAGDTLKVVTTFPPARGISRNLDYVDFSLLRSVHGLVVKPDNEDLKVVLADKAVTFTAPEGLTMSPNDAVRTLDAGNAPEYRNSFIDFVGSRQDDPLKLVQQREELINRAAGSEGRQRDIARLDLAQFYISNQFSYEAIGVLEVMESDLKSDDLKRRIRLTRGIADTLAGRPKDALAILGSGAFNEEVDALLWRSMAKAGAYDWVGARADALAAEGVIDAYPGWIKSKFLLDGIRAAIETKDTPMALRYIDMVDFASLDPEQVTEYQLLQGRLAEAEGRSPEALDIYGQVITADIRPTRAEAVYRTLLLLDQSGKLDIAKATDTLSAEVLLWRGNALEAEMDKLLAELYFRNRQYRQGFDTVKEAVSYYPDSRTVSDLLGEAQDRFADLYLNGRADELEPVDALALYYDFRQLTPAGNRGDEMIRNLARRLVKVDLLTQAADLLEYQIDSRLKGIAQAQIAADLAVIRIADRDPEGALRVLNRTRLADLPPQLERQRRILEARALIDADRQDLALDLLSKVTGRDADLLRVDGYWKSKNYDVASELIETMYSPGANPEPLSQVARMNLVKAAVGFVLSGDQLGLSRLRSKFGEEMSQSPEWPMFDFVTSEISATSVEFRKVARQVSGLDSLNAFLESYKQTYNGAEMTPDKPAPVTQG